MTSFKDFYPFYLSQHQNQTCRRLHFIGSVLVIALALRGIWQQDVRYVGFALLAGYGFAWVGHYFFEHNRPATFQHPIYSFLGDWVMFAQMCTGRIKF